MKRTFIYKILVLVLVVNSGCISKKKCYKRYPPDEVRVTTKIDTVFSVKNDTTILYDTTVIYKLDRIITHDSIFISDILEGDTLRVESNRSKALTYVSNKRLNTILIDKVDSIQILLKDAIKETNHFKEMYIKESNKEVKNIIIKEAPLYIYLISGGISIIMFILGVYFGIKSYNRKNNRYVH